MLGLHAVVDAVHTMEEAFRSSAGGWRREVVDSFFEAAAALRRVAERVGTDDQERSLQRLAAVRLHAPKGDSGGEVARSRPLIDAGREPGEDGVQAGVSAAPELTAAGPAGAAETGRREGDEAGEEAGGGAELLRVPFAKLDALLNRVGELVSVHSALEELLNRFAPELEAVGARRPLEAQVESLDLIAGALRDATMDLRLVPVGRVFQRFPSLARDLARRQGKQVRVILEGEDVELDKSTVDALSDPLLHLVRNAVDHGIRTAAERSAAGKPATGTVTLRASRVGDRVIVEVSDDGAGLDRRAILARARDDGLVGADERLTGPEIDELVFRGGFSTRTEATTVSGRGVGLEVVRRRVTALRGELSVGEAAGGGTRFVLALPLTLAIVPALLFETEGETLALPAAEVQETLRRVHPERAGGAEVVRHRDDLIPVARASRLLGWSGGGNGTDRAPAAAATSSAAFAIVLRRGNRTAAVLADRLLEQRDVVVRALPRSLGSVRGVSGATITPGGQVVLLLDSNGLLDLNLDLHRRDARAG
jgi:two-component system, chemotaxis family, sensor kinase CheA